MCTSPFNQEPCRAYFRRSPLSLILLSFARRRRQRAAVYQADKRCYEVLRIHSPLVCSSVEVMVCWRVCVCDGRLVWWRRCNETSCHQSSRRDSAQTPVRPAWWHRRATRQLNETASVTTFPVAAASPGTGSLRQMLWFIALGMHGLRAFTAVPSSTRALTLFGTVKWVSAYGLSYNKSCDGGCGR